RGFARSVRARGGTGLDGKTDRVREGRPEPWSRKSRDGNPGSGCRAGAGRAPNAQANLPGPLQGRHVARSRDAAPVKFSDSLAAAPLQWRKSINGARLSFMLAPTYCRRIFSIFFPFASSSISLSK